MKHIIPLVATAAVATIALAIGINHSKPDTPNPPKPLSQIETDENNTSKTIALVPLKIEYPLAHTNGTPKPLKGMPNMPPPAKPGFRRPPMMIPEGTTNVARGKQIYASDDDPIIGSIDMVTDGDKEAIDGSFIEFGPGRQQVTIDLGLQHNIYAITLWHYHKNALAARVYFDVIVQTADDPDFITHVKTLFNNDHDNTSGMGIGTDKNYIETHLGKIIDTQGVQGRYVRLYSNGNNLNPLNHLIEIEVYGQPVNSDSKAKS
ncbi:MAG: hypothetical protein K9M57_00830 [Phycisphaerae bacterium]|nr:hypothetical protein [Phycisphaerae bacterium]